MPFEHFDVLIVGAGLSGIDAAHHLREKCPTKTFVILESRAAIGGTWDLFRYPGVRSDSDMLTMGYAFRPWKNPKAIRSANIYRMRRARRASTSTSVFITRSYAPSGRHRMRAGRLRLPATCLTGVKRP